MNPARSFPEPLRGAFEHFQAAMELAIIALLAHREREQALAWVQIARDDAIKRVKDWGCEFTPMEEEVESARIAIALIEQSFRRVATALEFPGDDQATVAEP